MANSAILAASALLLLAYVLDIVGRRLRLPAVVLLIATGIAGRQVLDSVGLAFDWVDPIVPIVGTVGLILIVLEGALDLDVTRERTRLIVTSATAATLGFVLVLAGLTALFAATLPFTPAVAVLAAIPFAVISSAVAIPSATGFPAQPREFVIYESSLSDILGVLVFYSWLGADGAVARFAEELFGGGALSLVAAAGAAVGLYVLINRTEGHVRFLPMLAGLVCLYAIGKALHLSPLVLVLVCGLLLNNPHLIEWLPRVRAIAHPEYDRTLKEFKGLVAELTFATKSFFFLLLGYWTELAEMKVWQAWALAAGAVLLIYSSRYAVLRLLRQPDANRLLWIAPRGLITVLLFIGAAETRKVDAFPFGAVMLVVLATSSLTALAHRGRAPATAPAPAPELLPEAAATAGETPSR